MKKIYLDVETSGLNPFIHRLLEVGMIIDSDEFSALIKIPKYVFSVSTDPEAMRINGLTFDWLEEYGVSQSEAAEAILLFLRGVTPENRVWCAASPQFDLPFLHQLDIGIVNLPYRAIDLHTLFYAATGLSCGKDKIATYFNLPQEEKPHRALNGARHLKLLVETIEKRYANRY